MVDTIVYLILSSTMRTKEQEEIFKRWVDQFKPLLFKIVRVYGTEHNDEDDHFQEMVLQLCRSIPKFEKQCSTHTWVYRVALNTALKWSSRSKKVKLEKLPDALHIIERSNEAHPKLEWLYREISMLNAVDRSLTLLLLDGFSYEDMAEIIGITISNVGVKINRIKKRLKERAKLLKNEY